MRYVITGATGCLGMNLTKRLVKDGHEVIALGRNESLGATIRQLGATFKEMELSDLQGLKNEFKNAKTIFHCAARSSPWGRYNDFYQANVVGTKNVIEATPNHSRLIHVSSPSIYFDYKEQFNIKENAPLPLKPANHYVKTKWLAETLIDQVHYERRLEVVTIRPRAIFGPYDRSILPRILKSVKRGVLPIIGSGEHIIDITYVENVVESLILAANAPNIVCGRKYNITNDEPKPLIDILSSLFKALNRSLKIRRVPYPIANRFASFLEKIHHLPFLGEPRLTKYSCAILALGQTLNIDAAKQDFQYKPIVSIDQGMHQFAQWYQSQ